MKIKDELAEIEHQEVVVNRLTKRRDDLAKNLSNCGYNYIGAAPILRRAIDRIIELEDANG